MDKLDECKSAVGILTMIDADEVDVHITNVKYIAERFNWAISEVEALRGRVSEYERKIIEHNQLMDGTYE